MEDKELMAVLSMLDDPDELIFDSLRKKLISIGPEIIPMLESSWEESGSKLKQQRLENVIHNIQFTCCVEELEKWSANDQEDLLTGVLSVAKYQYPQLKKDEIIRDLDRLTRDVWLELNDNLTALEKVKVINTILFEVHGYSGNKKNYQSPQNSYINWVIESKKGNPLTLSIIYMLIAERLEIPIYGINLPEHFVVGYSYNSYEDLNSFDYEDMLFYINPFSKGTIFNKDEIDNFLKQLSIEKKKGYYLPCSNKDIIVRMLNNLILSYKKLGYGDKQDEIALLLNTIR